MNKIPYKENKKINSKELLNGSGDLCVTFEHVYEERGYKDVLIEEIEKFLGFVTEAATRQKAAEEAEQYPNDALQDLYHCVELTPEKVANIDIGEVLNHLRELRRTAKDELEISNLWKEFVEKNRNTLNQLRQLLGQMRCILERQPTRMYCFRTNVFGDKGSWMQKTEVEPKKEEEFVQLSLFDIDCVDDLC